ncbi:aldehyde dehydrogenase (NADP(+)) [Microbacterium ulmi]|uniref:Aldehyde dehydrogenase (NADP(+)) n=1 Tax=Microbacterium ulmi TaxID=179095 RepID=A0A7Y2M198_9MICO|nr:aldehyde dehydrogenase (NADP(+)) [Microbacterium ulmi]NII69045.1 NADP-dependent aldehyde dehydrogenase [Microbacterium ulmi]NNH04625.1 aldehyde dehydrogenase (NADP(+)) [Microbacterium ulmi]
MTDSTPSDIDRVATAAARAFRITAASSDAERASWLRAVADELDASASELVEIADRETALGAVRLRGEVGRTTGQLRLFATVVEEGSYLEAVIDHAVPDATPPRPDLRRILRPLGPVAVFAASNFPFAFSVAGGDTASALAVGCPVIVKAHSGHRELSRRVAELVSAALSAAGAPDGVFALVEGREAGVALIEHPAIAAGSFTGSVAGGRALADRAAARPAPIPFFGELGSINPVVVTEAADAARGAALAQGLAGSFQLGSGQFCTKPGLVFVPSGSAVEAALPAHVGAAPHRLLTDAIDRGFRDGLAHLAAVPGAEVVASAPATDDGIPQPLVYAVDLETFAEHAETLSAEVFGPVTLLVRYRDAEALPRVLEGLEGSLTATIHAEESDDVSPVLDVLAERAGRVLFAGWPTGVAVTWSQHHGGPWPATNTQHTSVGATAARRFQRPLAYQDAPARVLPAALLDENVLGIPRRVDGVLTLP